MQYNNYSDNTNHTFCIKNIQFYNDSTSDKHTLQMKQFNVSSNISVLIQQINLTNTLALH